MSDYRGGPRAWLDQLLGICLTLLVAAVALHWAVDLVQRNLPWLVGIAVVVTTGSVAVGLWRSRSRLGGW